MNKEAKDHYDKLLAEVYSWMSGDINEKAEAAKQYFISTGITEGRGKSAVDLGAGYGIHTKALVELGYEVTAVDFSRGLLDELKQNVPSAKIICEDITLFDFPHTPDLVLCMGDTLTHLDSNKTVINLINRISAVLPAGGYFFLSWRDLSTELQGTSRFIPVKSDDNRILTCFLEYLNEETVIVNDLLYQKGTGKWEFRTGSYTKLRLSKDLVEKTLEENAFRIISKENINGMEHFACIKI